MQDFGSGDTSSNLVGGILFLLSLPINFLSMVNKNPYTNEQDFV